MITAINSLRAYANVADGSPVGTVTVMRYAQPIKLRVTLHYGVGLYSLSVPIEHGYTSDIYFGMVFPGRNVGTSRPYWRNYWRGDYSSTQKTIPYSNEDSIDIQWKIVLDSSTGRRKIFGAFKILNAGVGQFSLAPIESTGSIDAHIGAGLDTHNNSAWVSNPEIPRTVIYVGSDGHIHPAQPINASDYFNFTVQYIFKYDSFSGYVVSGRTTFYNRALQSLSEANGSDASAQFTALSSEILSNKLTPLNAGSFSPDTFYRADIQSTGVPRLALSSDASSRIFVSGYPGFTCARFSASDSELATNWNFTAGRTIVS